MSTSNQTSHKSRNIALAVISALVLCVAIYSYWHYEWLHPNTDDAYVNAHVVRLYAQVSGPIKTVYIENNQSVKAGDPLLTIDPRPFLLAKDKAEASYRDAINQIQSLAGKIQANESAVVAAKAQFIQAQKAAARTFPLVKAGQASKAEGDAAREALDRTRAALHQAESELTANQALFGDYAKQHPQIQIAKAAFEQAKLNLSYTTITAPTDGLISNFSLRPGTFVSAGQQLFALVDTSTWWVDANFKETQISLIRPGNKAHVTIDTYPGKDFTGTVESISPSSGASFSILPAENASGNWVKVTQRFPIRILLAPAPQGTQFRVGASADVSVDVSAH